jgi:uncharacterized protein YydD (DUF2326 family)
MALSVLDSIVEQYNTLKNERDQIEKNHQNECARLNYRTKELEDKLSSLPISVLLSERHKLEEHIIECDRQIKFSQQKIEAYKKYIVKFDDIITKVCKHTWVRINGNNYSGINQCSICGQKTYFDNDS